MEKVITLQERVLRGILIAQIRGFMFSNKSKKPDRIIIPHIAKVDGVVVEYEKEKKDVGTNSKGL